MPRSSASPSPLWRCEAKRKREGPTKPPSLDRNLIIRRHLFSAGKNDVQRKIIVADKSGFRPVSDGDALYFSIVANAKSVVRRIIGKRFVLVHIHRAMARPACHSDRRISFRTAIDVGRIIKAGAQRLSGRHHFGERGGLRGGRRQTGHGDQGQNRSCFPFAPSSPSERPAPVRRAIARLLQAQLAGAKTTVTSPLFDSPSSDPCLRGK